MRQRSGFRAYCALDITWRRTQIDSACRGPRLQGRRRRADWRSREHSGGREVLASTATTLSHSTFRRRMRPTNAANHHLRPPRRAQEDDGVARVSRGRAQQGERLSRLAAVPTARLSRARAPQASLAGMSQLSGLAEMSLEREEGKEGRQASRHASPTAAQTARSKLSSLNSPPRPSLAAAGGSLEGVRQGGRPEVVLQHRDQSDAVDCAGALLQARRGPRLPEITRDHPRRSRAFTPHWALHFECRGSPVVYTWSREGRRPLPHPTTSCVETFT